MKLNMKFLPLKGLAIVIALVFQNSYGMENLGVEINYKKIMLPNLVHDKKKEAIRGNNRNNDDCPNSNRGSGWKVCFNGLNCEKSKKPDLLVHHSFPSHSCLSPGIRSVYIVNPEIGTVKEKTLSNNLSNEYTFSSKSVGESSVCKFGKLNDVYLANLEKKNARVESLKQENNVENNQWSSGRFSDCMVECPAKIEKISPNISKSGLVPVILDNGKVFIYDRINESQKLLDKIEGAKSIICLPDDLIAVGKSDGDISLVDPNNNEEKLTLSGHTDWVDSLTFDEDNPNVLVSLSSLGNELCLWNLDEYRKNN